MPNLKCMPLKNLKNLNSLSRCRVENFTVKQILQRKFSRPGTNQNGARCLYFGKKKNIGFVTKKIKKMFLKFVNIFGEGKH